MDQPNLEGCDEKLKRAETHIQALYGEINDFINSKPHKIVEDKDLERGKYEARIEVLREPDDPAWGVLLGDFIHNLRSALDHLVWQLVRLNNKRPSAENCFPIESTGTKYWCARKDGRPSARDGALRGVSDEHRAIIDGAQPYRRGQTADSHPLAIIKMLSNIDKHRLVHPTFVAILPPDPAELELISVENGVAHIEFDSGPLKDGAPIIRATLDPPNAKVNMKGELPIAIGFGEKRPVRAAALVHFLSDVKSVIEAFRADFA